MKTILTFILCLISIFIGFAKTTTGGNKKKSTTSDSKHNDDPGKVFAYCVKYGTNETIYLQIDNDICTGYTFSSVTVTQPNSYFHLLPQSNPITLLDMNYGVINSVPANSSYLIPINVKIDSLPVNLTQAAPQSLVLLTVNMLPANGNSKIECSRTKISVYVYISKEGCGQDGNANDTTFTTGKCYKCTANATNQFLLPTFAGFSWIPNIFGGSVSFTANCNFQQGDTVFFKFGDGDSIPLTSPNQTFAHIYQNGTFYPELIIRCKANKGECIYRAKTKFVVDGVLPLNEINLEYNHLDEANAISLSWNLQSNLPVVKYKVQRNLISADNKSQTWQTTGNVQNASWEDKDVKYGQVYYYRIIGVDINGAEVAFSNVISVILGGEIAVFPNPTHEKIDIKIDEREREGNKTVLSDLNGRIFFESANVPEYIDMRDLATGVYFLRIGSKRQRIVKE